MDASLLTSIAALIGVIISLVVAWKKTPAEKREADSSAAERFEQIASRAAQRIDDLEMRVDELECQLENAAKRIAELENENGDLRDWAERLVHQVRSFGHEPVIMKPKLKGL